MMKMLIQQLLPLKDCFTGTFVDHPAQNEPEITPQHSSWNTYSIMTEYTYNRSIDALTDGWVHCLHACFLHASGIHQKI